MKNIKPKRKGRPPLHGSYSLMVRAGELPENRKHIRAYLSAARAGLVRDLGPTEADLTTAQIILLDRIIGKLGVIRCIEEYIREVGVMKGQDVAPALQASYLAYSNAVRMDLAALGIKTRAGEGVIDLPAYIRSVDAAKKSETKARKASPRARQGQGETEGTGCPAQAQSEIVPLRGSGGDISGQAEGGIDCRAADGQDQDSGPGEIGDPEAAQGEKPS